MQTSPPEQLDGLPETQGATHVPSSGLQTWVPVQSAAMWHCSGATQPLVLIEHPLHVNVPVLPAPRIEAQVAPPSCAPSQASPPSLIPLPQSWHPDVTSVQYELQ